MDYQLDFRMITLLAWGPGHESKGGGAGLAKRVWAGIKLGRFNFVLVGETNKTANIGF